MVKEREKHTEMQRRKLIELFAAGIAHDLNNMIAAIVGYTELSLTSGLLPQDVRGNLLHLQEATSKTREFINQIGLISGRGLQARCVSIDICAIIRESLEMITADLPPDVEMQISVPERLDEAHIDPTLVHLLLEQLCQNAVQAMRENGGILRVSYIRAAEGRIPGAGEYVLEQPFLLLSVEDTGVGIDSRVLPYIYDPYFTTWGRGEGKGLGLAIVKGIVNGCGGEIYAASVPGRGSCFTLCFPCRRAGIGE